jgi:hypothetical protein
VFEHGYSFLRLYGKFTFDTENIVPFDDPVRGFEAAARQGELPQVTLIEPDYIDLPPGNDDHPPADMAEGQKLIERIARHARPELAQAAAERRRVVRRPLVVEEAAVLVVGDDEERSPPRGRVDERRRS